MAEPRNGLAAWLLGLKTFEDSPNWPRPPAVPQPTPRPQLHPVTGGERPQHAIDWIGDGLRYLKNVSKRGGGEQSSGVGAEAAGVNGENQGWTGSGAEIPSNDPRHASSSRQNMQSIFLDDDMLDEYLAWEKRLHQSQQ
jgi:hypothetical protein